MQGGQGMGMNGYGRPQYPMMRGGLPPMGNPMFGGMQKPAMFGGPQMGQAVQGGPQGFTPGNTPFGVGPTPGGASMTSPGQGMASLGSVGAFGGMTKPLSLGPVTGGQDTFPGIQPRMDPGAAWASGQPFGGPMTSPGQGAASFGSFGMPPTGGPDSFAEPRPMMKPGMSGGQDTFQKVPPRMMDTGRMLPGPSFGPMPPSPMPQMPLGPRTTGGMANLGNQLAQQPRTGTWMDDYLKPGTQDGVPLGFSGTMNGRNYLNGNAYAAEYLSQGTDPNQPSYAFNNILQQQWYPRMRQMGLLGG